MLLLYFFFGYVGNYSWVDGGPAFVGYQIRYVCLFLPFETRFLHAVSFFLLFLFLFSSDDISIHDLEPELLIDDLPNLFLAFHSLAFVR